MAPDDMISDNSSNEEERARSGEILSTLADDLSLKILIILSSMPSNPRKLSTVLGADETAVSRRLSKLEKLGLVEGRWVRREGVNVKLYYARSPEILIRIGAGGVSIDLGKPGGKAAHDLYFLPPPTPVFVGRESYIDALKKAVGNPIFVVGIAGIGKTSLVAKALSDSKIPVLWNQIYRGITFIQLLRRISLFLNLLGYSRLLEALDSGVTDERLLMNLLLEELSVRELVIVIDDYHLNTDPVIHDLVKSVSELGRIKSKLIIISRTMPRDCLGRCASIEVRGMGYGEARDLAEKVGLPLEDFERFYRVFGGHPHLLLLYSSLLKSHRSSEALSKTMEYIVSEVIDSLSPDERRVLELISIAEKPVPFSMIKLLGISDPKQAVRTLERMFLVKRLGEGYTANELIRETCARVTEDPEELHAIIASYHRSRGYVEDYLVAMKHYVDAGMYEEAAEMLPKLVESISQGKIGLHLYNEVLNKISRNTIRWKSPTNLGWFELALAIVEKLRGDPWSSLDHLERAREIGEAYSKRLLLRVKIEMGIIYRHLDRYEESLRELNQALRMSMELRDREARDSVLYNIAATYQQMGDLEKAVEILEHLVKRYMVFGNRFGEALARGWLSMAYRVMLRYGDSIDSLKTAMKIFEDLGAKHSLAIGYKEMASTLFMLADLKGSVEMLEKAATILGPGYPYLEASIYIDMSISKLLLGDLEAGERDLNKAEEIMTNNKIKMGEPLVLARTGRALARYLRGEDPSEDVAWSLGNIHKCSFYRKIYVMVICGAILWSIDSMKKRGEDILAQTLDMLEKAAKGREGEARLFIERLKKQISSIRKGKNL
ncbi:ArsR family transcriptional regulator [Desulfurococcaceae archaeon AG1]|nr:ArsR family transcriptional regulator [Desulfurococcaceae archaeon AG1]